MSDVAKSAHDAYRARYMNDGAGKPMFVEGYAAGYDASAARVAELEAAIAAAKFSGYPAHGSGWVIQVTGEPLALIELSKALRAARASTLGEGEKT